MKYKEEKLTKEEEQNSVWFITSVTSTIVTLITAGILIIQFSKHYKEKAPVQHVLFLFSGVLMLFLGAYLNIIVIRYTNNHKKEYGDFITIPRVLFKINIVFGIYAFYTMMKRFMMLRRKK